MIFVLLGVKSWQSHGKCLKKTLTRDRGLKGYVFPVKRLGISSSPWRYPHSWMVFARENPTKIDDLGVPPFQETSICFPKIV